MRQAAAGSLERFTVSSDGHPMAVWARRPATARGTVLLVHGLTWSSLPDFDLQVPGLHRSVMVGLAARGFATYAVDLRGYGQTPRDQTGWLTPRRAAADVVNVLAWVAAQHPGLAKPALVGWSRGAAISELVAQTAPSRVSAVVLFGFEFDPDAKFIDADEPSKPAMAKNTAEAAASDFVSPAVTPPAVVRAFVAQALKSDPIQIDLKNDDEFNLLAPGRLTVPTLVMYGSRDPGIASDEAAKFFARLGASDRELVVLPGADHAAHLENTHDMWMAAVVELLDEAASGQAVGDPMTEFAQERGMSRVEAFSDGVFAIAITLLILDLKVPPLADHWRARSLVDALWAERSSYLAFVMSFTVILVMWVNHHRIFSLIRRTDHSFLYWNGLLLMLVTIVPFPTSLLAEYLGAPGARAQVAAAVYAGHAVAITLAFTALWRHATKRPYLLLDGTQAEVARLWAQYRFGPFMYLTAFALAFVSAWLSVGLCVLFAGLFSLKGFLQKG